MPLSRGNSFPLASALTNGAAPLRWMHSPKRTSPVRPCSIAVITRLQHGWQRMCASACATEVSRRVHRRNAIASDFACPTGKARQMAVSLAKVLRRLRAPCVVSLGVVQPSPAFGLQLAQNERCSKLQPSSATHLCTQGRTSASTACGELVKTASFRDKGG